MAANGLGTGDEIAAIAVVFFFFVLLPGWVIADLVRRARRPPILKALVRALRKRGFAGVGRPDEPGVSSWQRDVPNTGGLDVCFFSIYSEPPEVMLHASARGSGTGAAAKPSTKDLLAEADAETERLLGLLDSRRAAKPWVKGGGVRLSVSARGSGGFLTSHPGTVARIWPEKSRIADDAGWNQPEQRKALFAGATDDPLFGHGEGALGDDLARWAARSFGTSLVLIPDSVLWIEAHAEGRYEVSVEFLLPASAAPMVMPAVAETFELLCAVYHALWRARDLPFERTGIS